MKKFSMSLVLVAVVLISAQAFAVITVRTLNCGAPKTADGRTIVGVSYKVQIRGGFDTHTVNPNGTIGAPIAPAFQLVSTVVTPGATPRVEPLTLISRNADGDYILAGNGLSVIVDNKISQASVVFAHTGATAVCD